MYILTDEKGRMVDTAEGVANALRLAVSHGFPKLPTALGLHRAGEHCHNGMTLANLGTAEPIPDADPSGSAPFTFR